MEKNTSLNERLIEELADLLNAERQLIEAFPKMIGASESAALKAALIDFLEISREHIHRLQGIFDNISQSSQGVMCKTIKELISESENVINKTEKGLARDAGIVSVAQQAEQYKIAGCGKASEHAADLGHTMIVEVLNKTLNEERAMNLHLNELAQYMINVQALNAFEPRQQSSQQQDPSLKNKGEGFYVVEGRFKRRLVKKKPKNTDISRFISEGNPNIQGPQEEMKENDQGKQNPEDQGDAS